jgi:hypothetical protein
MTDIEKESTEGESRLYIYKSLSKKVLNKLDELGYNITISDSLDILKDNLHYTISWK